jgi:hypothetical protein
MKKRKMIWLGLVALLMAGFAQAAAGSSLKLGEQDGAPGECEVRDYDAEAGTVRVMMGGATTNLPFSSFSSAAQQKITGWAEDKNFLSSSGLRISGEEVKYTEQIYEDGNGRDRGSLSGEKDMVSYVITLENRSQSVIKGVAVDCRIFYMYQHSFTDSKKTGRCFFEKQRVDLTPGEKKTFQTKPVPIRDASYAVAESSAYSFSSSGGLSGGPGVTNYKVKDRLKGLHIRLNKPGWDGKVIARDYKNGSVPGERDWTDYQLSRDRETAKEERLAAKKDKAPVVWDDARVEKAVRDAEGGDLIAAYRLYRHYREINDAEKRQYWADKCREMAEQNPDHKSCSRIIASLNKLEGAAK